MSYGTIAEYDYNLLTGIADNNGGDIEISYFHSILLSDPLPDGINDFPIFKYNKIKNQIIKSLSYLYSLLRLSLYIYIQRPDLIHIQWIKIPKIDRIFLHVYHSLGCKVIYTAHNLVPHNDNRKCVKRDYSRYYSDVDGIIVHSENTRNELSKTFGISLSKICVIPHGLLKIKHNEHDTNSFICNLREAIGIKNEIIVSCLGAQSYYKGTDIIINTWLKSHKLNSSSSIKLIIAGKAKGVDYSPVRDIDNVTIIDRYLTNEEYLALLRISDVTLLPYREISQSGSLLTAIYERKPIIVSHIGGLYQPLEIANIGWDIGEPTVENIEKQLVELINSPNIITEITANRTSWESIYKYYSWNRIGEQTINEYLKLLL